MCKNVDNKLNQIKEIEKDIRVTKITFEKEPHYIKKTKAKNEAEKCGQAS